MAGESVLNGKTCIQNNVERVHAFYVSEIQSLAHFRVPHDQIERTWGVECGVR